MLKRAFSPSPKAKYVSLRCFFFSQLGLIFYFETTDTGPDPITHCDLIINGVNGQLC